MTRILPLFFLLLTTPSVAGALETGTLEARALEAGFMAMTPEMERFVDERVSRRQSDAAMLRSLMDAVFGKQGLAITYGNVRTRSAAETFASGEGNCLSFTMLFVTLARHLGLEAHFNEVQEIVSWDRRGEIAVGNRHMFAEVETREGVARVDFLPGEEKRYRMVRRIDDRRALAHYLNNLGAEALANDDSGRALELFTRSLEIDPGFTPAWVNQGVAHRRRDEQAAAERSYLKALEVSPAETSAASNLALLYQITGRGKEAEPYLRLVERLNRKNPFHHFRLGMEASRGGDAAAAIRHLRRAILLLPGDVDFHTELAEAYADAGRRRKAERSLERALELAREERKKEWVAARLEALRAGG